MTRWFARRKPNVELLVGNQLEQRLAGRSLKFINEEDLRKEPIDLVVSCGGDGTILHVSSLFQGRECPPLLPFSLGSLGFLTTFGN